MLADRGAPANPTPESRRRPAASCPAKRAVSASYDVAVSLDPSPIDRRAFLGRTACALAAAGLPGCLAAGRASAPRVAPEADRLLLVRFGGGVRLGDVLPDGRRESHAPFLARRARSALFTRSLRLPLPAHHDLATRTLLAGAEGPSADALRAQPTLFEKVRKEFSAPIDALLAAGVPETSDAPDHGPEYAALPLAPEHRPLVRHDLSGDPTLGPVAHVAAANVMLARVCLGGALDGAPRSEARRERFFRDAVSSVLPAALRDGPLGPIAAATLGRRLLRGRPYVTDAEADTFLVEMTIEAMRRLRPRVAVLAFATPDLAHRGSLADYFAAVRRCDTLLARLDRFLDEDPAYAGRTARVVVPDCGRGDPRFFAHRDETGESVRRGFLVAWGPGVPARALPGSPTLADVGASLAAALGVGDKAPLPGLAFSIAGWENAS